MRIFVDANCAPHNKLERLERIKADRCKKAFQAGESNYDASLKKPG